MPSFGNANATFRASSRSQSTSEDFGGFATSRSRTVSANSTSSASAAALHHRRQVSNGSYDPPLSSRHDLRNGSTSTEDNRLPVANLNAAFEEVSSSRRNSSRASTVDPIQTQTESSSPTTRRPSGSTTPRLSPTAGSGSSSSAYAQTLNCDSDQDFEKLLESYDIVAISEALRRYLALEIQTSVSLASSKQLYAQVRRRFYERFNQILDRIFGDDDFSKRKYGGWMDYCMGFSGSSLSSSSSTSLYGSSSTNGAVSSSVSSLAAKRRSSRGPSGNTSSEVNESPTKGSVTSRVFNANARSPNRNGSDYVSKGMEVFLLNLSANGQAMVRLLGSEEANTSSMFFFLFRIAHPVEFKLELEMLPEQSQVSIIGRSPWTSVLFTQLLHKPLMKQHLDLRKPMLLVTITELFLVYFFRHQVSGMHSRSATNSSNDPVSSSVRRYRSSSLMDSLSDSFGRSRRRPEANWRMFYQEGIASLLRGNPYNVLLLQYLRMFLPDQSQATDKTQQRLNQKVRDHANLFLHVLIEFWLRQNLILFTDPTSEPFANRGRTQSSQMGPSVDNYHQPIQLSSPFAAVHTSTSYMAPSDDLLSSLLVTIIHLLSDSFYPVRFSSSTTASSRTRTMSTPRYGASPYGYTVAGGAGGGNTSGFVSGFGTGYLTSSVSIIRRPLYEFARLVFSRAPIGLSSSSFLAITDVWIAYLQPWCCRDWIKPHGGSSSSTRKMYDPAWASYVLANYHFYTTLLGAFIERTKELEFGSGDEKNLTLLERVLDVYNGPLLALLKNASAFLEKEHRQSHTSNWHRRSDAFENAQRNSRSLSAEQAQVLVHYTKALGVDGTPVPIHESFHRHAERTYDKLISDSGFVDSVDNAETSPPPQTASSPFHAVGASLLSGLSGSSSSSAYMDRVKRLCRELRRVFEISDAYVSSSTSHSMASSSSLASTSIFHVLAPVRDSKLPHLLSEEGKQQLLKGLRLCTPNVDAESIGYIGDPMLRPIRSNEIACLVRLSYRFSTWLNQKLGLRNPYETRQFEKNVLVDPNSSLVWFRFDFRFLASIPNLVMLSLLLVVVWLVYFW